MSGADLIAFLLYALRMLQPLKQLSQMPTTAQSSLASAERLFEMLDTPSESQTDRERETEATFDREVRFDDVGFSYGDAPVLSNISLHGQQGRGHALVGAERSREDHARRSDSAILRRRSRRDSDRRRRYARVSSCRLSARSRASSARTRFSSTTPSETTSPTARGLDYTDAEVEAAARAANAHDFITELPDGYATILGERGTRLSGGQTAAISDCTGLAQGSTDSHSRRGDFGAGHRVGEAGAGGGGQIVARANGVCDRSQALDNRACRPDSRSRPGRDHRARNSRRAAGGAGSVSPSLFAAIREHVLSERSNGFIGGIGAHSLPALSRRNGRERPGHLPSLRAGLAARGYNVTFLAEPHSNVEQSASRMATSRRKSAAKIPSRRGMSLHSKSFRSPATATGSPLRGA